jgi:hypothetical protein
MPCVLTHVNWRGKVGRWRRRRAPAAGWPPELESLLGAPKFGAKDCGGGLCVSYGRCTSLKGHRFGLEEENAAAAAMELGRSGQRLLRLAQLVFAKRERTRGMDLLAPTRAAKWP